MKRFWGHALVSTCAVAGIGLMHAACAHNNQSIYIASVEAPPVVGVGTQCTYTADPTLPTLNAGILDAELTNSYSAVMLIANQMIAQSNPDQARTESDTVEIQGVIVTVFDSSNPPKQLASFQRLAAATILPASGTTPSYGLVSAEVLDAKTIAAQSTGVGVGGTTRVVSHVTAFGQTLGGTSVESNEFEYPIDICNGCLITFPSGSADPLEPMPNCAASLASASSTSGMIVQPCALGQDQAVDCRLCQGNTNCEN